MSQRGRFFGIRMAGGSRHFASIPWLAPSVLRQKLLAKEGVRVTGFRYGIVGTWIDVEHDGHSFSAHNPLGEFWLFVCDPPCSVEMLSAVTKLVK